MNGVLKKVLTYFVLPLIIVALAYAIVTSVMKPVRFKKETEARKAVAVQQMKDIRTLQVAYKTSTGHYAATIDSLIDYYNNGKMSIVMQIGSADDSLAVAHTEAVKKSKRGKITGAELYELYLKGTMCR